MRRGRDRITDREGVRECSRYVGGYVSDNILNEDFADKGKGEDGAWRKIPLVLDCTDLLRLLLDGWDAMSKPLLNFKKGHINQNQKLL